MIVTGTTQVAWGSRMGNEFVGDARNVVQAGYVALNVTSGAPDYEPPAETPAPPEGFVDRTGQWRVLDRLAAESGRRESAAFVVVHGLSGAGKTAFVSCWLHRNRELFPDGQIYVEFNGRARSGGDVARHCLRSLGMREGDLPSSDAEALARLRTRTGGRRLAVFLDDVPASADLAGLRLAAPESLVFVASRHDLGDLLDAEVVALRGLDHDYALEALRAVCGRARVDSEPEAAERIARRCGWLPIALRVVARRLRRRTEWSLQEAADELADLDGLAEPLERVVRNALDFAVADLSGGAAELYRLLSVVPGPSFPAGAVAALAALSERESERELKELHQAGLVEKDDFGGYRFVGFVREHAGVQPEIPGERAALLRLITWYRRQGAFADCAVTGLERLRVTDVPAEENPFGKDEGKKWLVRERVNVLAALHSAAAEGRHADVVALCDGPLWALHNQHKHYRDTLAAFRAGVQSAEVLGEPVAEARMRALTTRVLMELGEFDAAHAEGERALEVAELSGHRRMVASAAEFRGRVHLEQASFSDALPYFERARAINAELGKSRGQALQEYFIGWCHDGLGEYDRAQRHLDAALELLRAVPYEDRIPARVRVALGRVHQHRGEHEQAVAAFRAAIEGVRERGASFDLVDPLTLLAESQVVRGETAAARENLATAAEIAEQQQSPRAGAIRRRLDELG